ncbi:MULTISPECIES: XdhC family protein [Mycolicibacterium]|uniref:Xanthine dehydrogenase subunit A n=1 Tax=Mycolicibacterium mageritense TaxID=53462 RepID=A0AAI8XSB2_MYCME|nr:XdhC/CoxI family protein [Mycolicibacterium mageritense]TXI65509.1 MAG: XshC-Cox1 family protein [Mycolicibacterium mageritense]BDY33011.1 putative xanthine dehydrogenase subunit A [Mycolicibacterium mageritense]GJJ20852.1 xanthine dehydrogenase [Mycolicibacterium mageritense]
MRELLGELTKRWRAGESVGLGTVVATFRSAPRPPGAAMMVGSDGCAYGSVSGGCVEGAVYDLAQAVAASGRPILQRYGVSDDDAFAVGLTCGGILDVYVEKVDRQSFPELGGIADDVEAGRPVAVATVVAHPNRSWVGRRLVIRPDETARVDSTVGSARADEAVRDDALGLLAAGHSATLTYGPDGERRGAGMRVFVSVFAPKPRMLVFGAIDFAAALARAGTFLGYHITVCDARPVFATRSRFPDADAVVVDWPHRYLAGENAAGRIDARTVVAVLTHDPKFDVPLLEVALRIPHLAYVGAMGSRRTHDDRSKRLREKGLSEAELARLCSPIGLDLGARTPEETAISIAAEIVARRWGGSGRHLTDTAGPIHESPHVPAVMSAGSRESSASR